MVQPIFVYGQDVLDMGKVLAVADGSARGVLSPEVKAKVRSSERKVLDIAGTPASVYGINTGFGILANTKISEADTRILQHKILQSHSVGVGEPVPRRIARLMLITKVHALAQGYSGVQLRTLERILWHLAEDVIPVVPEKGSVGASGDLAPLSHLGRYWRNTGFCRWPLDQKKGWRSSMGRNSSWLMLLRRLKGCIIASRRPIS